MILALDTETTGLDFFHGCRPFLVTAYDGETCFSWRGEVNPYTRDVYWNEEELEILQSYINNAYKIVMHNSQFDIRALSTIGIDVEPIFKKIEDTHIASHVLCSGDSHNLKDLALKYLDIDNQDEKKLEIAVQNAHKYAKEEGYDVAREGHKHFPGLVNESWWRMDYWLCPEECLKYGYMDAVMTWHLWKKFEAGMYLEDTYDCYKVRKKLIRIFYNITSRGTNFNIKAADEEINNLRRELEEARLEIKAKSGITYRFDPNKKAHLNDLLFNYCKVDVEHRTKTGRPSVDKNALAAYERTAVHPAIQALVKYRKIYSKLQHIRSLASWCDEHGRIHSTYNICGTRETRQSCSNPNTQNIDKKLKYLFQPPPGKLWLSLDLVNIELRIWAYETKNAELIDAFEKGQSVHLLIAEALAPLFLEYGNGQQKLDFTIFMSGDASKFKESKTYTDIKSGTFAWIYGGTDKKVNQTYFNTNSKTPPQCTERIKARFAGVAEYIASIPKELLQNLEKYTRYAVRCAGGYMLDTPESEPYKGSNYKIQGAAGYIMTLGMIAVSENKDYLENGCKMIGQVHDSLDIEMGYHPTMYNTIQSIVRSVEQAGEKIIPTCKADYKLIDPHNVYDAPF